MSKDSPEIKEKMTIKCADCDKHILEVITVKDGKESLTKLKVYCKCGGSSFLTTVLGTYKICPVEPFSLKDVQSAENRTEVYLN